MAEDPAESPTSPICIDDGHVSECPVTEEATGVSSDEHDRAIHNMQCINDDNAATGSAKFDANITAGTLSEPALEVADLVIYGSAVGSEMLFGKVIEVTATSIKVQRRGPLDVDNPVSITGPVEEHSRSVTRFEHLLTHVVRAASDKVKTFVGAPGCTFRGKPYFPGMRHTDIGNFVRGSIVRVPEACNVDETSSPSSSGFRQRALAGFIICSTRPNLKAVLCDVSLCSGFQLDSSNPWPQEALEIVGISKGSMFNLSF